MKPAAPGRTLAFGVPVIGIVALFSIALGPSNARACPMCKAKKVGKTALWYLPNRAMDLIDTVRLSASVGPKAGANVRLTDKITAGVSEMKVQRLGFNKGRKEFPVAEESIEGERGARLFGLETGTIERPKWELGLDLHALVGLRLGFDADDLCDFINGIVLYDRKGDDRGWTWGNKAEKEGE